MVSNTGSPPKGDFGGVGIANAGEPLYGDFHWGMRKNGGQLVGDSGERWKILLWQILVGGGSSKKW